VAYRALERIKFVDPGNESGLPWRAQASGRRCKSFELSLEKVVVRAVKDQVAVPGLLKGNLKTR